MRVGRSATRRWRARPRRFAIFRRSRPVPGRRGSSPWPPPRCATRPTARCSLNACDASWGFESRSSAGWRKLGTVSSERCEGSRCRTACSSISAVAASRSRRFAHRRLAKGVSLPFGALRLSEKFLESDPPTPKQLRRLRDHVRSHLAKARVTRLASGDRLVGTGGTLRNLAKIDRQTRRYPIGGVHGYELSVDRSWGGRRPSGGHQGETARRGSGTQRGARRFDCRRRRGHSDTGGVRARQTHPGLRVRACVKASCSGC